MNNNKKFIMIASGIALMTGLVITGYRLTNNHDKEGFFGARVATLSQTPWTSNIDGGGYNLTGVGSLGVVNPSTNNSISIDQNGNVGTDVATKGALHIENTGNTGIGLGVYTNIGAEADAALARFHIDNTAFDQSGIYIQNDSTGANSMYLNMTSGWTGAFGVIRIVLPASSSGRGIRIDGSGTGDAILVTATTGNGLEIDQNGNGEAIKIAHDDTGTIPSIDVVRNGNNAGSLSGIKVDVKNAGAGTDYGGLFLSDATSTVYIYSKGAFPGVIILEDEDGDGCTQITTLNGTINGATITCPTIN